jgi:hypothetical protein
MNVMFTVNLMQPEGDRQIQYFTINLSDALFEKAPLAFHTALQRETRAVLQDMVPFVVDAAYRGFELELKRREAEAEEGDGE